MAVMNNPARDIEVEETSDGIWMAAAAGRARLSRVGAAVVRIDVDGHAYTEFAELMAGPLNELLESHEHVFLGIDAEGMSSYDARFRYLWTEWIKRNQHSLDGVLMLFRSRIVQSAAVIINAVAGGRLIDACDVRDDFETRLAEAVEHDPGREVG